MTSGPGNAGDRRERGADIGAFGVVDVAHAADIARPMPSGAAGPGKPRSASQHRRQRQPDRLAERQRRERIGGIVQSR